MSLRHAILGLVSLEPTTGYDLSKTFGDSILYAWVAGQPQIYTELARMEREGLVTSRDAPRGRATKRLYDITDAGATELRRWVAEPNAYVQERDVVRLRSMLLDLAEPNHCEALFATHLAHYRPYLARVLRMLEAVKAQQTPLTQARLAKRPKREHASIIALRVISLQLKRDQALAEIAWAEAGLSIMATLRPNKRASKPAPAFARWNPAGTADHA
jgi:DNA-binding PadR family transcriptional regulator